jgi:hypothetical protein
VLDLPPRRDTSAPGQAMEFRVWTELIQQSRGALHVFLPLLDVGLDAVIHRMTDGEYIPVQVKCRTKEVNGFVEIGIRASMLVDDHALIIAGLLTDEGIGPMLLVVDEAAFKRLAARSPVGGQDVYTASLSMDSRRSHWRPYLVPRDRLAEHLLGSLPPVLSLEWADELGLAPGDRYTHWLGFLGESEVVRRLAQNPGLNIFRPFPDSEMVEVLVRKNVTGRFLGLQVKTAVPAAEHYGEARVAVRKATFAPTPNTFVVALAWLAEQQGFADECLLVPTDRLIELAVDEGTHWQLNFRPHSQERGRLDPYRRPLSALGELAETLIS